MNTKKQNRIILNELRNLLGIKLFLVGGSVRDAILERDSDDYDFISPLEPDEIEAAIKGAGKRAYCVGKRFGTLGMKHNGLKIEITTYRNEVYTRGSRKPEVTFVKGIEQDLSRRDFTINAMAMGPLGNVRDDHGGMKDIKKKIIRSVGSPNIRFREDPLRILRAVRFQSQLGFKIEHETLDIIKEKGYRLLNISKERWIQEMDKLLMGDHVGLALHTAWENDIFKWILPELQLQYNFDQNVESHKNPLHIHTLKAVEDAPKDLDIRWALLLHDIAKPFTRVQKYHRLENRTRTHYYKHELLGYEMVEKIARHLKWSNDRREAVKDYVLNHMTDESPLKKHDLKAKD